MATIGWFFQSLGQSQKTPTLIQLKKSELMSSGSQRHRPWPLPTPTVPVGSQESESQHFSGHDAKLL